MATAEEIIAILLELTKKFTSDEPLEVVLQGVTDSLLKLLPGDHASIRVFNDIRTELLCGARSGTGATSRPLTFRQREGIVGWVAEHGRAARIEDTERDPRFMVIRDQGFKVRSILCVPLLSAGKTIGVAAVSSPERASFGPRDETLMLLVSNCVVPIVERARLEQLKLVDDVTLAYNHSFLFPRLEEEIRRNAPTGKPLSVLIFDVDRLKAVNAAYGAGGGDQALKIVADRARSGIRDRQRLVRKGGGTFVLLLPEEDGPMALGRAEDLCKTVSGQPIEVRGNPVRLTISAGVAQFNGHERSADLLKRAERAMQAAKAKGRNQAAM